MVLKRSVFEIQKQRTKSCKDPSYGYWEINQNVLKFAVWPFFLLQFSPLPIVHRSTVVAKKTKLGYAGECKVLPHHSHMVVYDYWTAIYTLNCEWENSAGGGHCVPSS